jgi:hypothetical protein
MIADRRADGFSLSDREAAMNRLGTFSAMAFAYVVLAGGPAAAAEPATDANVVTGLDFSHSVGLDEHWVVQEGLGRALLSPAAGTVDADWFRGRC